MVDEMSTQTKIEDSRSKMPTQLAAYGAKMTRPSLVVVAPKNFRLPLMLDEMSTQLKLVARSKMPTHSAFPGAKTTRPSLAVVAPKNLLLVLAWLAEIAAQLKSLNSCEGGGASGGGGGGGGGGGECNGKHGQKR